MSDRSFGSIAMILLCAAPLCAAGTYVVDPRMPGAGDQNPGTEQAPWTTIGHAAATARAGDTVLIRTGVYREAVVLKRGGAAEQPIRFQADEASTVVVTGADRLTGWTKEA